MEVVLEVWSAGGVLEGVPDCSAGGAYCSW